MRIKRADANIIISNLPEDLTAGDLAGLFDEFGLVLSARIGRGGADLKLPARGFVDLAPAASVERAIASLDGRVLRTRKLKVRKAPPPRPKAAPRQPAPNRTNG